MISADTLVVAILSGLGGGLVGTWLQIRHERDEAFRDRQITAADDLSTGLLQATIGLERAYSTCLKHGFFTAEQKLTLRNPSTGTIASEISEAFKQAKGMIEEADARRARVSLLFGPVSAPDRWATLAMHGLDLCYSALDRWPDPDLEAYSHERSETKKSLAGFNKNALADAKGRPWYKRSRIVLAVRRRWRRLRRAGG